MAALPLPAAVPRAALPQRARLVFGALLLVMLVAALDQTIVSTALPTIVGELGGLEHLSWVVTAYLLATTAVGPLYGKLGDLYGRKRLLQIAILLFLAGSALCGLSRNMIELIAFRALQGLGGGGLMVTTMAAVADIIPLRDRGRYQGVFGAVFAAATVVGPLLGGFFVDHLSWRWIFYVNIPIGLIALFVVSGAFEAVPAPRRRAIDYTGALLLTAALTVIVLLTNLAGSTAARGSSAIVTLMVFGVLLVAAFAWNEARAAEPILPPSLFANRVFTVASAVGLITSLALYGSVTYLPLYLQVVRGLSPSQSGLQLTPMMAGVLASSTISGHLVSRLGRYKPFPVIGTAVMTGALWLLSRLSAETSPWLASADMLALGLGVGMQMQILVLAVQGAVDYRDLGAATSGVSLFSAIGGSLGVALFGAIFADRFRAEIARQLPPGAAVPSPMEIARLPPPLHDAYVSAFVAALDEVFFVAAAIAALAFALTWLLKDVPLGRTAGSGGIGGSIPMLRDVSSLRELERIVSVLTRRENRRLVYERIAAGAGVALGAPETWLLLRLGERPPTTPATLAPELRLDIARLAALLARLGEQALAETDADGRVRLTAAGRDACLRLVAARRDGIAEILAAWSPAEHAEVRALIERLARALISEAPLPAQPRRRLGC